MDKNLLQNYINLEYSSYKIAKITNKSQTTIRYWLKKHNLITKINKIEGYKKCTTCKKTLKEEFFYNRENNRKQSSCKDCFNIYVKNRWINRKIEAIKYKGNKCEDCKNTFPYPIYDFHHLDPKEKDFDWTKMKLTSLTKMKKELDKCVLLCSNCHRLRHHNIFVENKRLKLLI